MNRARIAAMRKKYLKKDGKEKTKMHCESTACESFNIYM